MLTVSWNSVGHLECFLPDRIFTSVCFATIPVSARSILATPLTSRRNLVYIGIFFTVQMAFTLVAASYFAAADGHANGSMALKKAGGVFAFLSGLLGYYTVGNLMCQQALSFRFPMGDTSRFFLKEKRS